MNIPPRYTYCVMVTVVLTVIAYFISPTIAVGILVGGLISPLFAMCQPTSQQSVAPVASSTAQTPAKSFSVAAATSAEQDETVIISRADYTGDVKTIYVGNLPYRANEAAIRKLFSEYGLVLSVRLVKDRDTGKRRGYGFVEMPADAADAAIAALNETEYLQRTLKVREANEKKEVLKPEDESSNSAEL
ncbi:RNA recognition motif domain-containing protein [Tolumonas lignilytica]|uniref:RNA recognition motif domain-containing protein n=1 Tax=Tolumonas lignilytica TaxID=1283284 RepID=UPI0005711E75|nr:hypothetical protein [Tolumonas lignilytica]